jgi:hypothetical protein
MACNLTWNNINNSTITRWQRWVQKFWRCLNHKSMESHHLLLICQYQSCQVPRIWPESHAFKFWFCRYSTSAHILAQWVIPEKIHIPPTEEISAVRKGRGEKIVCDNSKCIRTSEGGRGVNFQFPPWGWYGCFLEWPNFTYEYGGALIKSYIFYLI